ncbi:MAG: T4 RnlA family RNA ligase [Candidatus Dojkabacteria bacterium]|nr:T4 RnlA family RNA ligase [Candidatus Dojkabacteria bacterium]
MTFKFPIIRNINDLLPNIEVKNFIVKKTEHYIVVCYYLNSEEIFPNRFQFPEKYSYAIECRGIKFCSKTGKILARPFHKFFNLNERPDSSYEEILKLHSMSKKITITEKLDGSMIHPMKLSNGEILWCTKMGTNIISAMAENYVKSCNDKYEKFIKWCFDQGEMGWTPIFEYVSPKNKIVIEYEENLVLLAIRDNVTGTYIEY